MKTPGGKAAEIKPKATAHGGEAPSPRLVEGPDKKTQEDVHEVCALFVRAVTTSKLYPSGHESVAVLRDNFLNRLTAFLESRSDLTLEVKQDAFLLEGAVVHQDDNPLRSLPYFFHKDGMQKLIFLKGLGREEFADFMETIRVVALLPLEVGDIVDAIWQKDFEHIRYISPDEFIESKIAGDQDMPRTLDLDRDKMHQGRVEFTPEDAAEIARRSLEAAKLTPSDPDPAGEFLPPLTEEDSRTLEAAVQTSRRETAERDIPELMYELLHLEDRPQAYGQILAFLRQYLQDRIQKAEFIRVIRTLDRVGDVLRRLHATSPSRVTAIEAFFRTMRESFPQDKIRELVLERKAFDVPAFFEYLRFVGLPALSVGADLVERVAKPEFLVEAMTFFEEMAKENFARFLREGRPARTHFNLAAVGICARRSDPAAVSFLIEALGWKSKDVKFKAIEALGRSSDSRARTRLKGLFEDPDEDLRVEAFKAAPAAEDRNLLAELVAIAGGKKFSEKSETEQEAVLAALGRSRKDEAVDVLRAKLLKRRLLGRAKSAPARLFALHALEKMATPVAVEALTSARKIRPKKLRTEVLAALGRLSASGEKGKAL